MRKQITLPKLVFAFILISLIFNMVSAQTFQQSVKKTSLDRSINDHFGNVVALSDNTALIGAPNEDEDTNNNNTLEAAGSAYFYQLNENGDWTEAQKIVASDRGLAARFGSSVAIKGDYAIIGAFTANTISASGTAINGSGAAYLFHRENGDWIEIQKLTASDKAAGDWFGYAVAISDHFAVVGAYMEDENTNGEDTKSGAGAAYIFEIQANGTWTEIQKITANNREAYDNFGAAIAISNNNIIVGAPQDDFDNSNSTYVNAAGAAYLFKKTADNQWTQTQKITATDRKPATLFGWSVAISDDHAIIGTLENDDDDGSESDEMAGAGSAYIFDLNESGLWIESQKLIPSDAHIYDQFGNAVTISGNYAAIGAYKKTVLDSESTTANDGGATYIFHLTDGVWEETQKIIAADISTGDNFGNAVALSDNKLVVGAAMDDDDAGSIYFFKTNENFVSITECESYTSPSENYIYTESGSYTDTITTATGLDSIITINLTITTIDVSVNNNNGVLTASETAANYQWINCETNEPITGATDREFTPSEAGNYAVIITKGTCARTSECFEINVLGIDKSIDQELKLYPNPTSKDITIDFGNTTNTIHLAIFTVTGKMVLEKNNVLDNRINLSTENLSNGVYFVKIQSNDQQQVLRFIKQ